MQRTAWIFGTIFLIVWVLTNIPAFNDAQGYNFGLFKIDPIDNIVHFLTVVLGFFAAWHSTYWSRWYVGLFGALYALDALTGMTTQMGLLDGSMLTSLSSGLPVWNPDFGMHNFLVNLPHIGIAAAMLLSVSVLYPWVMKRKSFLELFMLWKIFDRAAW